VNAGEPNGHAPVLFDAELERWLVAAVLADPARLQRLDSLAAAELWDPLARRAFSAIRNVAAQGSALTVAAVRAHLAADVLLHDPDPNPRLNEHPQLGDLAWFDRLVATALPPGELPIIGWSARISKLALERDAEKEAGEAPAREQMEYDRITFEELESDGAPAIVPPPGFGRPFAEFVGDVEPDDNPADVFDAHGLIVRGEPSLLIGDPKVGKTLLLEDLILHMAAGRSEFCGLRIYRRPRVLLFLREDSERTTKRRLWQLARGAGIEHWELAEYLVIDATSPLYFDVPSLTAKLERQLAGFDICAIDSLSTIHNADENSVERMAPVMNRWRDLSLGTSTAIPLVHHFRKRGVDASNGSGASTGNVLQRARGSSLIAATTRHAVGVDKGPDEHEMTVSIESNHEVDVRPFVIRRRFGVDEHGRKFIRHERAGSLIDAREAQTVALVDPIVLQIIRASGVDGIGKRDLRSGTVDRLRAERGAGVRATKVDEAADRLVNGGQIVKRGDRWRIA
jgi:hypothetical protein